MQTIKYNFCTNIKHVYVASSACLLGDKVRYDAKLKANKFCLNIIPRYLQIIKFCPEVAIGLSVPRPPVQLINTDKGIQALGVENPTLDISRKLNNYADCFLNNYKSVSGIIFKSRSPSCGLNSTPLYNKNAETIGFTSGLVAAALQKQHPEIPMIEEDQLDSHWSWFVFCCYLFADARQYERDMRGYYQSHLKQLGLEQKGWGSMTNLPEFFQLIKHNTDCQQLFKTTR